MSKTGCIISHEGIEYLCGLIRDINVLDTKLIDDINIKSNGTFSSVRINTLLNALKTDCNDFANSLVSNLSRLELKVVTNEADMIEHNKLYLIKKSGETSYSQYVIVTNDSGVDEKILLGTTNINMSDYYTITQADNKFVLKTDFDALKTEVTKVKTDLTTHTNDTDIHITTAERDKWNTSIINDVTSSTDKVYSSNKVDELIANISNKIDALKPLKSMIPIMTSNTTPSGEVLYSSFANNTAYPYYAFDNTDKYWASSTSKNSYIGYDFKKYVCIRRISFLVKYENTNECRIKNFRFEALDSNNVWTTLFIGVANNDVTNIQEFDIPNYNYYKKYRLFIIDGYEGTVYNGLSYFNMFGYEQ